MVQNRVSAYSPLTARRFGPSGGATADWQEAARAQGAAASRRMEAFLSEHPKACLGIGLAVGVFLGWLIKRR
jgi:ElaB/YqjD/DUF883 family membrane-anchored ribosome-binding protein